MRAHVVLLRSSTSINSEAEASPSTRRSRWLRAVTTAGPTTVANRADPAGNAYTIHITRVSLEIRAHHWRAYAAADTAVHSIRCRTRDIASRSKLRSEVTSCAAA